MADHLQDQIVDAFAAVAVAAGLVPSGHVVVEGVDDLPEDGVPAIQIEAGAETLDARSNVVTPRTVLRTFDIEARLTVSQNANYRKAAGALLAGLERAVHASKSSATLGGLVADGLHLVATTPDRDGNAARVTYSIRTLWRARYLCKENTPDTPAS